MRRSLYILAMVAGATLLHSCTAMFNSMAYGSSDLYRTDNRVAVAERLRAEAEAEAAEAEARRAQWEARQAAAEAERAEAEYYASLRDEEPNFLNIVADDYQSAYARRLYGFQSPTYRLPSSYYNLLGNSALFYASAYDPAFYNVMVSGDQVWVEPRYITSMFGSWGAVNITFGLYSSPWTYGWSYRANPFYYSCWGYPRYSWYDWNWNICYNPWHSSWWDPWYYHYYPHYHHHHHGGYYPPQRPPQHRPGYNDPNHGRPGHNHVTGSGASSGRPNQNLNGDRGSTADRYTSPTTNRNYGNKDSNRRPVSGSTSQGIYKGSNTTVGGKSTISIGSSSSKPGGSTSTRVEVPTKGGSSVSTGSSSTGSNKGSASNFRQGTTSSRSTAVSGGKSSSSSSSTKVGGSTSSRRGTSVGSSSSKSSSSNSSSSYRSSSSSSRSSSSSSYRSSSSSSSRNSVTGYNASSSSRSSSGYSSGSSSGGGSRSGGSTSSRR